MGACYLLTGNEKEAIASLNKTVSLGETPYLEDARFYLAKAYLRSRDITAAQRELEKVVELEGDRGSEARQLLQQLAILSKTSP
jgi:tetratricopeptide (TPR) repeat protein